LRGCLNVNCCSVFSGTLNRSQSINLYYDMDACPLNRDQLVRSLEFAVNSCFKKIFAFESRTVIAKSKTLFNCPPVFATMTIRKYKLLHKYYICLDNELCRLFNERAIASLST